MKGKSRKFGPRLTVSLTNDYYDTLNALAEKDEVSLSWVVRRAIDEYLRKHRKKIDSSRPMRGLRNDRPPAAERPQDR